MPVIEYEGQQHEFPDDFTQEQIAKALRTVPKAPREDVTAGMALSGVPVLGAYIPQAEAGIRAAMQPLTGVGEPGKTFSERYARNLPLREADYARAEAERPWLATGLKIGGGTAALAPLGATALGARALGAVGPMAARIPLGAASGAGIAAADAAARARMCAPLPGGRRPGGGRGAGRAGYWRRRAGRAQPAAGGALGGRAAGRPDGPRCPDQTISAGGYRGPSCRAWPAGHGVRIRREPARPGAGRRHPAGAGPADYLPAHGGACCGCARAHRRQHHGGARPAPGPGAAAFAARRRRGRSRPTRSTRPSARPGCIPRRRSAAWCQCSSATVCSPMPSG